MFLLCVQDKNGKMDIGELFGALNEMGLKLERRDLKAIMEACDIDVRHSVMRVMGCCSGVGLDDSNHRVTSLAGIFCACVCFVVFVLVVFG
jgi:hypothetical protein